MTAIPASPPPLLPRCVGIPNFLLRLANVRNDGMREKDTKEASPPKSYASLHVVRAGELPPLFRRAPPPPEAAYPELESLSLCDISSCARSLCLLLRPPRASILAGAAPPGLRVCDISFPPCSAPSPPSPGPQAAEPQISGPSLRLLRVCARHPSIHPSPGGRPPDGGATLGRASASTPRHPRLVASSLSSFPPD